jgi:hypothetical protein
MRKVTSRTLSPVSICISGRVGPSRSRRAAGASGRSDRLDLDALRRPGEQALVAVLALGAGGQLDPRHQIEAARQTLVLGMAHGRRGPHRRGVVGLNASSCPCVRGSAARARSPGGVGVATGTRRLVSARAQQLLRLGGDPRERKRRNDQLDAKDLESARRGSPARPSARASASSSKSITSRGVDHEIDVDARDSVCRGGR